MKTAFFNNIFFQVDNNEIHLSAPFHQFMKAARLDFHNEGVNFILKVLEREKNQLRKFNHEFLG